MRESDFAFANDVRAAVDLRTPRFSRALLWATTALFVVGLIWANFAILDEVKRGNGRVVPSSQTQVVQSLEGGLVEAILVREGEVVNKGDPLIRIDDTNFASQFGEVRERRAAMAARVARLQAMAEGKSKVAIDRQLAALAPRAVEAELASFDAQQRKLQQDLETARQQEQQKRRELDEQRAGEKRLTETSELLSKEVELTRRLFQQRVVPEIEMLRLERQYADVQGQLNVARQSNLKAEAAIREAISRAATVEASFRAQAGDDLAKAKADLAVLEETIRAAQDRVRRAELRAPVHGILNKINVTTVGAVVQPGSVVMELVPLDDTLLVEARIRPQDIAFVHPGQNAVVKVTAYDPYVYGSLKAKVERISADALVDDKEKGESFYRVMVRTDKNSLGTADHPLPIIPGMVTTVEILTGRKSVLDYLLRPARILRDEALRER